MKTIKFISGIVLVISGIVLGSLLLFSCEIDEEQNLLFRLKDTLKATGTWTAGGSTDSFQFASDGTFTAKINGRTGEGTFRYAESFDRSFWSSSRRVGTFTLTWKSGNILPQTDRLEVHKERNGDRYFKFGGNKYTQIS